MTPERWKAVGEIFDAALAVVTGERAVWLEQASKGDSELQREVASLLASHDAAPRGFVQERIRKVLASFNEANMDPQHAIVGPYRLVRELGRGGMGTVFLAERNDDEYRAQVAIKLVRPGMDTEFILTRFRRERQTLARLQHPNIARLLDGGTTAKGVPYIVMEYIDGPSLTKYAKRRALSIPDRLRLFMAMCAAVDYAHRNFVVHRDVKPGNILVGPDGVPKLLDFGVCKLLRDDSAHDSAGTPLTPAYASPEQVHGGPVTPLSDIYSLGVILYELLAGTIPYRRENASSPAISHTFGTAPVVLPSVAAKDMSHARQLSGDLDHIVMRALERDPAGRYQWAAQMSDDLERYFAKEPIQARPQSKSYVALKFIQRNKGKVSALIAVILAFGVGLSVSLRETRLADARVQQILAQANLSSLRTSRDASLDIYRAVINEQEGDELAAAGKFSDATDAYLQSADATASCMKLGQAACLIIYIQSTGKLARNEIALRHRTEAVQYADRALHAGDGLPVSAAPRAYAAMGLTYAALQSSPLEAPGDHHQAQLWLEKSLTAWRAAHSDSGISADDQREMKEVEDALSRISHEQKTE